MPSYADTWNETYGRNMSSNPQHIIVSGRYDEEAETFDVMEYELETDVANALLEMRETSRRDPQASQQNEGAEWDEAMAMDIEIEYGDISPITIVPDTNVMISYLELLDALTKFSTFCALPVSILIPGIVLTELDGLRKNQDRTCQREAQRANIWVAAELKKHGFVRGQRDMATLVPGGNWKRQYYASGKANPDGYIQDCCEYEAARYPGTRRVVLTLDENCMGQCLMNGIPSIKPQSRRTCRDLLNQLGVDTPEIDAAFKAFSESSSRPERFISKKQNGTGGAPGSKPKSSQVPNNYNSRTQKSKSNPPVHNSAVPGHADLMDMDEPHSISNPPQIYYIDPRDDLHNQLMAYLEAAVPPLLEKTINLLKDKQAEPVEKEKQDSSASIYAARRNKTKQKRITSTLPTEAEYKSWRPIQALTFLTEHPPPHVSEPAHIAALATFVQDRRKGREFGRGDWGNAMVGVEALFPDLKHVFGLAIFDAFDRCMQ